ncbi:MAG: hypothetical protein Q4G35_03255 [Propionibacteriaceae bacterium]|nr:hypothetical protein [Propionibacteriaceae bacterium]
MLVPADAATAAIQWLTARQVWPVTGKARTGRHLQVIATGGNPRDDAGAYNVHQLTITAWGKSPDDDLEPERAAARALAVLRDAATIGFLGEYPCTAVEVLSNPYPDPDPISSRARASFSVRLHLRATHRKEP